MCILRGVYVLLVGNITFPDRNKYALISQIVKYITKKTGMRNYTQRMSAFENTVHRGSCIVLILSHLCMLLCTYNKLRGGLQCLVSTTLFKILYLFIFLKI